MMTIDLEQCTKGGRVHNLAGKEWGQRVRTEFGLDELDDLQGPIRVEVPHHVYAISPSFFLGMFSKSLEALGGASSFHEHYDFVATDVILAQIEDGVLDWEFRSRVRAYA